MGTLAGNLSHLNLNLYYLVNKMIAAATLLLLAAMAATANGNKQAEFDAWAKQFNKAYSNPSDRMNAYQVYLTNDRHIQSMNAKKLSYKLAHNQFSDLTSDEFYDKYVGYKDKASYLDHVGSNVKLIKFENMPKSVDWTKKNAVTPVKNQEQCGSCWAFSTTGSLEGAYAIASGTLDSLSEQQLVDCDHVGGDSGCNGGTMDNAFQWIETNGGLCLEKDYQYQGVDQPCRKTCKPAVTLTGHVDVPKGNETQLKGAIAIGPVSIAIEADKSSFQFYTSGVYNDKSCGNKLDHGVLAVGYGTMSDGGDYYKVKNSWGSTWGMNGYILIAQHSDICGIADAATYPTGARAANGTQPPSPSPGPSPSPCTHVYPDCVANADQASCQACSKCSWCSDGYYCSNDSCP